MASATIYHNPRCSKSRQTLAILEEQGLETDIVLYLENPPNAKTLGKLLSMLGYEPRELMRRKESEYKENNLDDETLSKADLISAMIKMPKLIERPIVVIGNKAVIGRPPENVLEII